MMQYYQMNLEELISEGPYKPRKEVMAETTGNWMYFCRFCNRAVGLYNIGKWNKDEKGWIDRRDACTFGHQVDWSDAPPLEEVKER